MNKLASLFTLILTFVSVSLYSQVAHDSELYVTLYKMDSLVFDVGFNRCEVSVYDTIVSEDLEFYHDQGGITRSRDEFIETARKNICGNADQKPIRKLVPGSIQVYPLSSNGKLYGAIQSGLHEFYIKEPEKEMYKTSEAKFTHLWLLENEQWILKRVLSFDHK